MMQDEHGHYTDGLAHGDTVTVAPGAFEFIPGGGDLLARLRSGERFTVVEFDGDPLLAARVKLANGNCAGLWVHRARCTKEAAA